jgi:hypothetical protein
LASRIHITNKHNTLGWTKQTIDSSNKMGLKIQTTDKSNEEKNSRNDSEQQAVLKDTSSG